MRERERLLGTRKVVLCIEITSRESTRWLVQAAHRVAENQFSSFVGDLLNLEPLFFEMRDVQSSMCVCHYEYSKIQLAFDDLYEAIINMTKCRTLYTPVQCSLHISISSSHNLESIQYLLQEV